MSRYMSKSAAKRQPLTTKRASGDYYKGKRGTKEGRHTRKGKYIIDRRKQLELVIPDLTDFKVIIMIMIITLLFPKAHATDSRPSQLDVVSLSFLFLSQLKPYIQFNATKYPPEDPRTRTMAQPVNN